MDKEDIPFLSASELSRLIERKDVSPVEATEAYLDRIDALDFKFNSYLALCRKDALQAAREAESAIVQGNYLGPMHGIPVAVKDQLWTKGVRTTGGSHILADFIPDEDATVVAKLKVAGAVILGKTNLTEFALGGSSQRYSVPRNPWDLDMYAGGSSGGSATATAAFLCATSIGEDTGGSIRYPASWCGLVGLRPSCGRVSRYGIMRGLWSTDTAGPISRTVEDAAITLEAIAGYDPRDAYTWDTPVPDYRKALGAGIKGVRVGIISEQINSEEVETEVREIVVNATSVLGELGASVEEVSIPLTKHSSTIMSVLMAVEPALDHRVWARERLQDYGRMRRRGLLLGSILPAQAYYKAQKLRSLLRRQILETLDTYDVLALPTMGRSAQRIEGHDPSIGIQPATTLTYLLTTMFPASGTPAISVPCGLTPTGLPVGLQIAGRPGGEEMVLKVAHAYEQHTPWHTARPPEA